MGQASSNWYWISEISVSTPRKNLATTASPIIIRRSGYQEARRACLTFSVHCVLTRRCSAGHCGNFRIKRSSHCSLQIGDSHSTLEPSNARLEVIMEKSSPKLQCPWMSSSGFSLPVRPHSSPSTVMEWAQGSSSLLPSPALGIS